MNNEKLNEMAEENASKFYHAQGSIEQVMPWSDCKESFINGFYSALSLPEVKAMKEALAYYANKDNWVYGDVPMHVYAHDDAGHTARKALDDMGWLK